MKAPALRFNLPRRSNQRIFECLFFRVQLKSSESRPKKNSSAVAIFSIHLIFQLNLFVNLFCSLINANGTLLQFYLVSEKKFKNLEIIAFLLLPLLEPLTLESYFVL